jgi:cytochrome c biogenesis protein CcdA
MGASAGLIPCPSALVVLLGAVAQHQLALGLVMIVAFSLGLAATLTALGIAVVHATKLPVPGRVAAAAADRERVRDRLRGRRAHRPGRGAIRMIRSRGRCERGSTRLCGSGAT